MLLAEILLHSVDNTLTPTELKDVKNFINTAQHLHYESNFSQMLESHFEQLSFFRLLLIDYFQFKQTPHSVNALFIVLTVASSVKPQLDQPAIAVPLQFKEDVRAFVLSQSQVIKSIKNFHNPRQIQLENIESS